MKRFITLTFALLMIASSANLVTAQQRRAASTAQQSRRNHQKVVPAKRVAESDAELGKKYFDSENYAKAIGHVKKAAASGDLDSQVRLADMTFFGNEVEMDREKAHDMIDQAIEKGSAYAMERKGFYLICEGMKQEGFEWFKKAAEAGLGVRDELLSHRRLRNHSTQCRGSSQILPYGSRTRQHGRSGFLRALPDKRRSRCGEDSTRRHCPNRKSLQAIAAQLV